MEATRQQKALAESQMLEEERIISGVGSIEAAYAALSGVSFGGLSRDLEDNERGRLRLRR